MRPDVVVITSCLTSRDPLPLELEYYMSTASFMKTYSFVYVSSPSSVQFPHCILVVSSLGQKRKPESSPDVCHFVRISEWTPNVEYVAVRPGHLESPYKSQLWALQTIVITTVYHL